jgi:hypothetical protein
MASSALNPMRRHRDGRAFTLIRHLRGSLPAGGDIESGAREFNVVSRNLEVGLATAIRLATSRYLEAVRDSLTDGCAARILGDGDCEIGADPATEGQIEGGTR